MLRETQRLDGDTEPEFKHAPELQSFDDGFVPSSTPRTLTRLHRQNTPKTLPPGLTTIANALPTEVALAAYDFTVSANEPWGTYLRLCGEEGGELQLSSLGAEPEVEALAKRVLQSFWRHSASRYLRSDLGEIHGFSVWAVIGGVGCQTAYHVDYAEMYRRRTNILRPPMHAATIQVSPVAPEDIEGGTFGAHLDGLKHYARHGYKNRLSPAGGNNGAPTADWGVCERWQYVPYRFNQATLSDGELPHAADKVLRWPPHLRRVVIGINSMGAQEGIVEARVPQHSRAFNRMLREQKLKAMVAQNPQLLAMAAAKLQAKTNAKAEERVRCMICHG